MIRQLHDWYNMLCILSSIMLISFQDTPMLCWFLSHFLVLSVKITLHNGYMIKSVQRMMMKITDVIHNFTYERMLKLPNLHSFERRIEVFMWSGGYHGREDLLGEFLCG